MTDAINNRLAQACHRLLRPLVRVLLRHGVAYDDFAEVVKTAYTEIAREDFTPADKRATDSRVAIVTGLTRKEVKRLRENPDDSYQLSEWGGANRATRVLSGWHRDPDFTDAYGEPRPLTLEGSEASFSALVRRYSGDIPASAVLEELERTGAVARDSANLLTARNRAYVPGAGTDELIRMLGSAGHDLLATIEYNLTRPADARPYFQRTVFNTQVDPRVLPVFHRLASEHGQQLLEILDDWLEQHEVGRDQPDGVRTGVGIYYFQDGQRRGSQN